VREGQTSWRARQYQCTSDTGRVLSDLKRKFAREKLVERHAQRVQVRTRGVSWFTAALRRSINPRARRALIGRAEKLLWSHVGEGACWASHILWARERQLARQNRP
jgi:hypothetical protein